MQFLHHPALGNGPSCIAGISGYGMYDLAEHVGDGHSGRAEWWWVGRGDEPILVES